MLNMTFIIENNCFIVSGIIKYPYLDLKIFFVALLEPKLGKTQVKIQTQVKIPERRRFQSSAKGVYESII